MQFLNLLIKPVWILVIDRAVQNILPQDVYGNYFALLNFSLMFFILLDLGLNGYNSTRASRDQNKILELAGSIIGIKVLLSVVYLTVVFIVGGMLGYTSAEFKLLGLLCLLQIITSFNQYLRTIVSSLQKFKADGVFMVLDRVIVVALCSVLIWGGVKGFELTIDRFVYIQILGVLLVLIVLLIFLRKKLAGLKLSFGFGNMKAVLVKSWPFALLITLMGLFNYVDGVMLKQLSGDGEAGNYAMGYRLFYALLMFAQIFSGVLLPFFSKNIKNVTVIENIARYTSKLLLFVGFTVAFICLAYSTELIEVLYPDKFSVKASNTFSVLMIGFVGSALVLVFGTLLTANLSLRQLNIAAGLTLVLNLVSNALLIPIYGAIGAAFATLVSQLLFGSICLFLSYRTFNFDIDYTNLGKQIVGLIALFTVTVFLKQYFETPIVHFLMITLTIILGAYLFKIVEKKQLKSLLKK